MEWPNVLHVISTNGTVLGKYTAHLESQEDENKFKNANQSINQTNNTQNKKPTNNQKTHSQMKKKEENKGKK